MYYPATKMMIWRSVAVLLATLALIGGITYAALLSQPSVVKNNTVSTAVANLKVSPNGSGYSNTFDGYSFGGIVPGGAPSNGRTVFLRNDGTTPLDMKLSIAKTLTNTDGMDLSKVYLKLTPLEGGAVQSFSFKSLMDASETGGVPLLSNFHLIPTQMQAFIMQVSMDSDAVNASSASLDKVDISFGAVAVN